jgi:phosphotransferase system IIB component
MSETLCKKIKELTHQQNNLTRLREKFASDSLASRTRIKQLEQECISLLEEIDKDGISMKEGNVSYKFIIRTKMNKPPTHEKVIRIREIIKDESMTSDEAAKAILNYNKTKTKPGQKYLHISKSIV